MRLWTPRTETLLPRAQVAAVSGAVEAECLELAVAQLAKHPAHTPLAVAAFDLLAARLGYPGCREYASVHALQLCWLWAASGREVTALWGAGELLLGGALFVLCALGRCCYTASCVGQRVGCLICWL